MKHKILENVDFEIDCPHCDEEFSVNSNQIGSTVVFPHCKGKTKLQDGNFTDTLKAANDSVDKFLDGLFK